MTRPTNPRRRSSLALLVLLAVPAAQACPVCFGDPDSPLVQGAVQGIVLLLAVTGIVLGGFVGLGTFWFVRARRASLMPGGFACPAARPPGASAGSGEPAPGQPCEFGADRSATVQP
ncbi:MAG: hypothetical protein CHACPFDD_02771 [Phycisphaerae bacterium]|nr:hypothetical protein [Phycisphaerae bacterium]